MVSTVVGRVRDIDPSTAVKAAVKVSSGSNLTLYGLQTVDGYLLQEDDRILLRGQTNGADNGIWVASAGDWRRADDFDGTRDIAKGTRIYVTDGSVANEEWFVSSDDPVIGSTALQFTLTGAAAAEAFARSTHYVSRTAAEAATVLDLVQFISVLHNGVLCFYQRASSGTCLATNGGAQLWEPVRNMPAYLQHWGVTTYASESAALAAGAAMSGSERTAEQARITAAIGGWDGEMRLRGFVEFYDRIIHNPAQRFTLDRGVEYDGFCVSSRFNTGSAPECVSTGLPAAGGAEIISYNILLDQSPAAASGNRVDLIGYPVAIRVAGDFNNIHHVRIQRAVDGMAATAAGATNNGGLYAGKWEIGAFNDALNLDGALHFTDIESIDIWPYGFSGNANLLSIYNDGNAVPATIARMDNLRVGRIGVFQGGPIVMDTGVSGALPWQVDTISLDSDWAYLVLGRGQSQIDKLYGTEVIDASHQAYKIRVTNGHHIINAIDLVGDADALVQVEGGYVKIVGRLRQQNADNLCINVTGGTIDISECELVGLGASHNVALVANSGGTVRVGAIEYSTRAEMVTAVAALALDGVPTGHVVRAEGLDYLKMPAAHALYGTDPISDLPGYAAGGEFWTPEHNGTTGTANDTAVVDAASAAAAAAGMDLVFEGKEYRGGFKARSYSTWRGVIGKTILRVHESAGSQQSTVYHNVNTTDGQLIEFHAIGIIFHGSKSNGTGEVAFLVWGLQDCSFTDCIFRDAETYGFAAQARPGHAQSDTQDGLTMTRCGFIDNGGTTFDGCDVKYCTRMHFTDCWAFGNGNAGINVRGTGSFNGNRSYSNGRANFRFQATDLSAGHPSRFTGAGNFSGATTSDPTLQIQASAVNDTHVNLGFECAGAATSGCEVSGAGTVYGVLTLNSHNNTTHGFHLTGDSCGRLVIYGLLEDNGGDGGLIAAAGQNVHFAGLAEGNTGTQWNDLGTNNHARTWP